MTTKIIAGKKYYLLGELDGKELWVSDFELVVDPEDGLEIWDGGYIEGGEPQFVSEILDWRNGGNIELRNKSKRIKLREGIDESFFYTLFARYYALLEAVIRLACGEVVRRECYPSNEEKNLIEQINDYIQREIVVPFREMMEVK